MTSALSPSLTERIRLVADALDAAGIPYACGGAIALNYWAEPRATRDLDVNIFLREDGAPRTLDALAMAGVPIQRERDLPPILRDAQVRIPWDDMPLDLFFASVPFLDACAGRRVTVTFAGAPLSILSAEDILICKTLFNREKDWPDIRTIVQMQGARLDGAYIRSWLHAMIGPDDERTARVERLLIGVAPGIG